MNKAGMSIAIMNKTLFFCFKTSNDNTVGIKITLRYKDTCGKQKHNIDQIKGGRHRKERQVALTIHVGSVY